MLETLRGTVTYKPEGLSITKTQIDYTISLPFWVGLFFVPIFKKKEMVIIMWCEKLKNGSVKYCERYTDPLTYKKKKVSVTKPKDTPQNRNKAARELNDKISKACQLKSMPNQITLKALQQEYLQAQQLTYKMSTVKRNETITTIVINILGPNVIVENLTAQYVNAKLLDTGKPISTLNTYVTRFKAMMNWGYLNDYHDNHKLTARLRLFKDTTQEANVTVKYLEPEEITRLIDYIKKNELWHWYYVTNILLLTGLRFGELAALETSDINLKERIIYINKTYDSNNKIVTTPKTDKSIRDIHIQPELMDMLKQCLIWRNQVLQEKNLYSRIFIPSIRTGRHMNHGGYEKFLRETSERILQHKITPHILRHTHASLLAANGMTPDEIARRLGHSKSTITKDIYIHVTQKIIENDNKKLDAIQLTS